MAYIKKINGYLVKDEEARDQIIALSGTVQTVSQTATSAYDLAGSANTLADEAYNLAEDAYNLAQGRGTAYVFDTEGQMTIELKRADNTTYRIGDQLLIKEADVPDYWVSEIKQNNDGTYGYYGITVLETQKVDLSGYAEKTGTYLNMTAGKVGSSLTVQIYNESGTAQQVTFDGSTPVTVGSATTPVAYAYDAKYAENADKATTAGHATTADSADKATKDGSGNNIVNTYATKTALNAEKITLKFVLDSDSTDTGELKILKNGLEITPTT